jgi:hypothetical protein
VTQTDGLRWTVSLASLEIIIAEPLRNFSDKLVGRIV